MNQRVMPLAGFHDDVATIAAVPARRPAARDKLFASEREASVAAIPSFYSNCGFIDEHKSLVARRWLTNKKSLGPKARLCGASACARVTIATIYSAAMGSTITYLPD